MNWGAMQGGSVSRWVIPSSVAVASIVGVPEADREREPEREPERERVERRASRGSVVRRLYATVVAVAEPRPLLRDDVEALEGERDLGRACDLAGDRAGDGGAASKEPLVTGCARWRRGDDLWRGVTRAAVVAVCIA